MTNPRTNVRVWYSWILLPGLMVLGMACGPQHDAIEKDGGDSMTSAQVSIGAHALVFQRMSTGQAILRTPELGTAASPSVMIVAVGRGQVSAFEPPIDNVNDVAFVQLDSTRTYTRWPDSGTALYALENARGGSGHVVSTNTPPEDEVTLAVVEVFGRRVEDVAWKEQLHPHSLWRLRRWLFSENSVTSGKVQTSGPATLVAFWWGDASVEDEKTAVPSDGFEVIDSVLESGALVQCAVAVKRVHEAGQYDVTWTTSPLQGAQMWLVAVADSPVESAQP